MKDFLERIPVPTAGLALGLISLGKLFTENKFLYLLFGFISMLFFALILLRIIVDCKGIKQEFSNPVIASVSATICMTTMQLSTYIATYSYHIAFALWLSAVIAHTCLIIWFTKTHIYKGSLKNYYPTLFVCYVGIIVATITSPTYHLEQLGKLIFYFGFTVCVILIGIISIRYIKHPVEEAHRPLFCIYAAPMSLSLVGYLSVEDDISISFVLLVLVIAQLLLFIVYSRLPHFIALKFYPSYAAMTFPFVISATALKKALVYFQTQGILIPSYFELLNNIEIALAVIMCTYVALCYLQYFTKLFNETINNQKMLS